MPPSAPCPGETVKDQVSEVPAGCPIPLGQSLGSCLLTHYLGASPCSYVFRAHHQTLDVPVALKILPAGTGATACGAYEQVWREAQLLCQLNHPHVVRLWDFAADSVPPYLILELVEGGTLQDLMQRHARLPLSLLLPICRQVTEGLAAAGRLGIVHRAINPRNILLTREGAAKVSGLGLGALATSHMLAANQAAALAFLAPEQLDDTAVVDYRADLFSLGVTIYFALTGQLPFAGQSRAELARSHATTRPSPVDELRPDLPPVLSSFIMRLLARDPAARFDTYLDVLLALDEILAASNVTTPVPRDLAEPEERARARQFLKEAFAAQRAGQKTMARRLLKASVEIEPRQAIAWYWLARLSEKPSEVIGYLEQALQVDPNHPEARQMVQAQRLSAADYAARSGSRTEARQLLLALVELEPRHQEGLLALAGVAESTDEAIGYLQRVLEFHPDNEKAQAGLDWLRGQVKTAMATWICPLCQALQPQPQRRCPTCGGLVCWDDVEEVLTNGPCNTTRITAVLQQRQQRIVREPRAEHQQALGLAYLNLRQPRQALRYLKAASELEPEDDELHRQVDQLTQYVTDQAHQGHRPRVLLVHDDKAISEWLMLTLEDEGYDVWTAADGEQARQVLLEQTPDLILVDLASSTAGRQLCKRIRRAPRNRRVPILLVSQQDGLFARLWTWFVGLTHHVAKPADPHLLVALVKQHCPAKVFVD